MVVVLLISGIWVTTQATWQGFFIRVGRIKRGSIQGYIGATGLDFKTFHLSFERPVQVQLPQVNLLDYDGLDDWEPSCEHTT